MPGKADGAAGLMGWPFSYKNREDEAFLKDKDGNQFCSGNDSQEHLELSDRNINDVKTKTVVWGKGYTSIRMDNTE